MRSALVRLAASCRGKLCPGILRPPDQAVVAAGTLLGVMAMAATWLVSGGAGGRLMEPGDPPRQSAAFRLDVNTASAAELDLLPNIGEKRARQIIVERQRGAFVRPEDLAYRIKGIGDKTVAKMKPYLLPMTDAAASPLTADPRMSPPALSDPPRADVPLASATTPRPRPALRPGRTSE
jgi:competence protein ComEA